MVSPSQARVAWSPGDWICPSCGAKNWQTKKCKECGAPHPELGVYRAEEKAGGADAYHTAATKPPRLVLQAPEVTGAVAAKSSLAAGYYVAQAPTFTTNATRIFVPCGTTAICFGVKTAKQTGALPDHEGQVLALCVPHSDYSLAASGCAEPLATCTGAGEVRLWDSRTLENLGNTQRLASAVLAARWPRADTIFVVAEIGNPRRPKAAKVVRIDVASLAAPKKVSMPVQLQADEFMGFDANADAIAIIDGLELCVWKEGWPHCHRHQIDNPRAKKLTAVTIDPTGRYISAGDDTGVVWTWWGVLDSVDLQRSVPQRFHWHANPVASIAHCGPLIVSGGVESVLCYRRADDDSPQFIPRLPAPIRHIAASFDGSRICASLADNSVALVQDLHDWVVPRYISGIAVAPVEDSTPCTAAINDSRATGLRRPVLHPLPRGMLAASGHGQRVQFVDVNNSIVQGQTLTLRPDSRARSPGNLNPEQRWSLWQVAVSVGGTCIMTVERRLSPALHNFDEEFAESYCVKWWRRTKDDERFFLDSMSNDVHDAEITVAISHPHREHVFVTASSDGNFKCWDLPDVDPEFAEELSGQRCFQCFSMGTWHSRPILSGSFSMDGSLLALGYDGFVVLWEPSQAEEVHTMALGDDGEQPSQLSFTMACGLILLIAGTKAPDGGERIVCWDMMSFEVVAELDLRKSVPGVGRCVFRIAQPRSLEEALGFILFREQPEEALTADDSNQLQVWRLTTDSTAETIDFTLHALASLPPRRSVVDACFREGDETRVLCWVSDLALWDLDLTNTVAVSEESPSKQAPMAAVDEEVTRGGKAARLVGGMVANMKALEAADGKLRRLVAPALRTTAIQQAGVLPRFLGSVLPAHVPSHLLPPPAILWSGVLSVFAKPPPGAETPLPGDGAQTAKDRGDAATIAKAAELHKGPKSEFVDVDWMDQLVQDALA